MFAHCTAILSEFINCMPGTHKPGRGLIYQLDSKQSVKNETQMTFEGKIIKILLTTGLEVSQIYICP